MEIEHEIEHLLDAIEKELNLLEQVAVSMNHEIGPQDVTSLQSILATLEPLQLP